MPDRLAGQWPRWVTETSVGILIPIVFVLLVIPVSALMSDRAPYAFNFVAVLLAAVLAGWRSGLLALVFGQLLIAFAIVEPQWTLDIDGRERVWALVIATASQLLLLLVITLYQREVDKGVAEHEKRLALQEHARREIDHRIRNNLQTVLALIHLQSQRSEQAAARDALQQIAERINAVATVTERLAIRGEDFGLVSLNDHLCGLCEQLEQALADGISIHCDVVEAESGAVEATYIGLIVNELVTNAIKHAFGDREDGWVRVSGDADGEALRLLVGDNGSGMKLVKPARGSGIGQKLVEAFVRELGGTHELATSPEGTTHTILIPGIFPPAVPDPGVSDARRSFGTAAAAS